MFVEGGEKELFIDFIFLLFHYGFSLFLYLYSIKFYWGLWSSECSCFLSCYYADGNKNR
jgi:hypothetical protein